VAVQAGQGPPQGHFRGQQMHEAAADGVQRLEEAFLRVGPAVRRPRIAPAQCVTVSDVPVTGLASLLYVMRAR